MSRLGLHAGMAEVVKKPLIVLMVGLRSADGVLSAIEVVISVVP